MTFQELVLLLRADLFRLSLPINGVMANNPNWLKVLHPRFMPVLLVRLARYFYLSRWLGFLSPVFTWLNVFIFGIEFTARCDVGPGLMLPHTVGTIVGAVKIGQNVTIFQGVTLGALSADLIFDPTLRPILNDNIIIGAGAKVLGAVLIGNNVKIGANAVVLESLPDNVVAVGIPAKIVKSSVGF